ncbi:MAG: carbonic anhydrase [Bacteroidetes bacterium]|nr:MAG: carbonic anhydrase [Bacteroidota bacterium]
MQTQTKETQAAMSPDTALDMLKQGNQRFVQSQKVDRDHNQQVTETTGGQYPFAVVLSCIDSRVPAEIVFDQGIGDIFSVRVAGNVVNEDVLGSIEYGCKVAGSKVLVVMGHTKCGAVTSACKGVELGNITPLLAKIKPAVQAIEPGGTVSDPDKIEEVAVKNVELSIDQIRKESPILAEMEKNGEIKIVGASYSVATGAVEFL